MSANSRLSSSNWKLFLICLLSMLPVKESKTFVNNDFCMICCWHNFLKYHVHRFLSSLPFRVKLYAHLGNERPTPMITLMVILITQPLVSMSIEIDGSVLLWYFLSSIYGVRSDLNVITSITAHLVLVLIGPKAAGDTSWSQYPQDWFTGDAM